jgi:hypothetical protein
VRHGLAAAASALLLQACIVVPQTREYYDTGCQMMSKEIVLEAAVIGRFQGCAGEACAVMLATMGAVTAASAVVSGSIALVGNVAYWVERQGRCTR